MWVYEEDIVVDNTNNKTRKLSELINETHQNPKYLPNVDLPHNIVATPDLKTACQDATLIVLVLPHQFLPTLLPTIRKHVHPSCRGVSLIKGLDYDADRARPVLISKSIQQSMQQSVPSFSCGVLMGANVANEVAKGRMCESTLACQFQNSDNERTRLIFDSPPSFRVTRIADVAGAEVCGALKNVIALGAGFVDGCFGPSGGNTKAALLRVGLQEMGLFATTFFQHADPSTTLWESCGVADLITTCFGGRNRKCAQAFAEWQQTNGRNSSPSAQECQERWAKIERDLLNGQKLQGTLTAKEVFTTLEASGKLPMFPLMHTVYKIAFEGQPVSSIVNGIIVGPTSLPTARL